MTTTPKIGISACLAGLPLRYDGSHKRQAHILAYFKHKAALLPLCPEVGCGLGVPRETIRLWGDPVAPRLETTVAGRDVTAQMQTWIETTLPELAARHAIKGFIFKALSPSCGYGNTPVWRADGQAISGQGLFARAISLNLPHIICADEEMLRTTAELEAFWRKLQSK